MVILELVERVTPAVVGTTVEIPLRPGEAGVVEAWCARTGNQLVSVTGGVAVVRRGPVPGPTRPERWPHTNVPCA